MGDRVRTIALTTACIICVLWSTFFLLMTVASIAVTHSAGGPIPLASRLGMAVITLAVAAPGVILTRISSRELRRMRNQRSGPRGFEVKLTK